MIDENLNLHCTLFIDTVDSLVGHKILEKKTQFSYCKQSIFFEAIFSKFERTNMEFRAISIISCQNILFSNIVGAK